MDSGIGRSVKFLRTKANITQKELAKALGYKSQASIAKIESGERDIPLSVLARMAEILNVSPAAFFEPMPEDSDGLQEYLPYLAQASDETVRTIRYMLHMPEKKICRSSAMTG